MLKVLHIVRSLELGGLETLVVRMSIYAWEKKIYKPYICCLYGGGEGLGVLAQDNGINIFSLNMECGKKNILVLPDFVRFIKSEKFDILHSHNSLAHLYGAAASLITGIPLIHTKHGNILPFNSWKAKCLNMIAACITRKIIAVSKQVEETVKKNYHITKKKVFTVYNGVDPQIFCRVENDKWRINKKSELDLPQEGIVVGIIARLAKEKDHETLLASLKIVLSKPEKMAHGQKVDLLIVGDGPLRQQLEDAVKNLLLTDHVHFLGFREDIQDLLQIVDLFVLSSLTEGISLTLLESMAAEKPVVATEVGGNKEVVAHNQTGLLVPAQDPGKMAEAILSILNDPEKANRMGEAGRKRVEEKFSLDRMISEYEMVYKEVLKIDNKE